ncbi:mechanosensitive ion channel domain-containing protein [Massilibacteroides sp.]|uniref:mechanosensitive ion channel family protein n=1 Tax=Massilibacteroides sp. TaxID=2034766 RepID=UPI00260AAADF|nr:mechanosensitive ion channel domain-containing protein [Massilibacteroides sp.]MDD4515598.1 mechanosensitive ion channel [Massilibacteroides sp.]
MDNFRIWVCGLLELFGVSTEAAERFDNFVVFAFIILIAYFIDIICRNIILKIFTHIAAKTKNLWDDLIIERKIIHKMINIVPSIFIYIMLPFAFPESEHANTLDFLMRLCEVYIIAISTRFAYASLGLIHEVYIRKQTMGNKPVKGFVQILQVIVVLIGVIAIIAVLINKSATSLLAGLGASAAILTLVFKDTILGFVAGIQLSVNDMLRPGDWITMEKYNADGVVIEVTLYAVKVRNWDNTVTTIPPYALISDSFQNWRNMFESGGRRVKRSVNIDMNSVKFCTPEMLQRFRKISLITDYIDGKEEELLAYNTTHHVDSSISVNGRRQTNLGVFRNYLFRYLRNHPAINQDLTCMVRHLQPTDKGIPIELYFFSSDRAWVVYEGLQADVFDHVLAIIPEFDLHVFQNVSGYDIRNVKIENK